ncbi:hypothetical protein PYCC9005_003322 [Savitreella phatthalungensis]
MPSSTNSSAFPWKRREPPQSLMTSTTGQRSWSRLGLRSRSNTADDDTELDNRRRAAVAAASEHGRGSSRSQSALGFYGRGQIGFGDRAREAYIGGRPQQQQRSISHDACASLSTSNFASAAGSHERETSARSQNGSGRSSLSADDTDPTSYPLSQRPRNIPHPDILVAKRKPTPPGNSAGSASIKRSFSFQMLTSTPARVDIESNMSGHAPGNEETSLIPLRQPPVYDEPVPSYYSTHDQNGGQPPFQEPLSFTKERRPQFVSRSVTTATDMATAAAQRAFAAANRSTSPVTPLSPSNIIFVQPISTNRPVTMASTLRKPAKQQTLAQAERSAFRSPQRLDSPAQISHAQTTQTRQNSTEARPIGPQDDVEPMRAGIKTAGGGLSAGHDELLSEPMPAILNRLPASEASLTAADLGFDFDFESALPANLSKTLALPEASGDASDHRLQELQHFDTDELERAQTAGARRLGFLSGFNIRTSTAGNGAVHPLARRSYSSNVPAVPPVPSSLPSLGTHRSISNPAQNTTTTAALNDVNSENISHSPSSSRYTLSSPGLSKDVPAPQRQPRKMRSTSWLRSVGHSLSSIGSFPGKRLTDSSGDNLRKSHRDSGKDEPNAPQLTLNLK